MPLQSRCHLTSAFLLCLLATLPSQCQAQQSQVPTPAPTTQTVSYPDSESGLEHLAKDILTALKDGNTDHAKALAQSMVLPDPAAWYHQTFGDYSGDKEIGNYNNQRAQLPLEILAFFKNAMQSGNSIVSAKRLGAKCDDSDGEHAFPTLDARVNATALYDLRLASVNRYLRLWPIAYVDGTFRFVAEPRPWDYFAPHPHPTAVAAKTTPNQETNEEQIERRIRQGGAVAAAKLIKRVTPYYPADAQAEHLQGTVELHAIIAKDGTISDLRVIKGYCSLARASLDAVKKWRYTPTLFNGEPVEVDTTIEVIFTLRR